MERIEQWVGVDVCKHWLDVQLRPQGTSFRVGNNDSGSRALLTQLKVPGAVGRSIFEATGGDERQVALRLWSLTDPVVVINARQARNFALLEGPKGYKLLINGPKPTRLMRRF